MSTSRNFPPTWLASLHSVSPTVSSNVPLVKATGGMPSDRGSPLLEAAAHRLLCRVRGAGVVERVVVVAKEGCRRFQFAYCRLDGGGPRRRS